MVELTFFGGDVKSWTNFNTFESEKNNIKHLQNHHPQKGSQSLLESMPRLPFLPPHSLPDPEVNYLAAGRPEKGTWCFQVAWMTQHLLTGPPPPSARSLWAGQSQCHAECGILRCSLPTRAHNCRWSHGSVTPRPPSAIPFPSPPSAFHALGELGSSQLIARGTQCIKFPLK